MFYLDRPTADEFLEVYKGVIQNFTTYSEEFTTGPCIAMEIRQEDCVKKFRQVCGPMDPVVGKTLRKGTIRAKFGVDRERNAVHCTDLEEDGILEVLDPTKLASESHLFRASISSAFSRSEEDGKSACTLEHLDYKFARILKILS